MILFVAAFAAACAWMVFARPNVLRWSLENSERQWRSLPRRAPVDVSIIVPARNEADLLPRLLTSISRSTLQPAEVIVVDDGSTDATATIAGLYDVRVISAPSPPPGWLGKSWACHVGAQQACGARLLFLDADVDLAANGLQVLLAEHDKLGQGLLSVQPHHRPQRPYEQMSAFFNIVGPMGTGAFALRRPRPLRSAFGPCFLTRATDYAMVGGHESVRNEVVEDIALATRFADLGQPVHVLLGDDLVAFRMYPRGLRQLIDGWTKNIAAGASRGHSLSSILAALWVAALSAVAVAVLRGVWTWIRGGPTPWWELAAWAVASVQVHVLLRKVGRFYALTAMLFPIPLTFFVAVFARSLIRLVLRRPVLWSGRSVPSRPAPHTRR